MVKIRHQKFGEES